MREAGGKLIAIIVTSMLLFSWKVPSMLYDPEKLNMMNNILADLYDKSANDDIREMFLNELRLIIPYTQASFWLHREGSGGYISEPVSIDMSKSFLDRYKYFAEKDYISWLYNHSCSIVYCGSKILSDSVWHATEFYKGYLLPEKIAFSCGIVFIKDSHLIGLVNLFRTDIFSDFSEEELLALEFFKPHLENIMFKYNNKHQFEENAEEAFQHRISSALDIMVLRFNLSPREKEILECVCWGFTAIQIAENLKISLSTVKKHMNHIFSKMGIFHKNQLFALILDCIKTSIYS